ncbi:hypothetical protein K457DRAFT_157874 [Linnemannia elongata AG-77]|uniref:Uncharacterized protein n=1 Tax=Linnemannia elongata AG-77 TaxID=1314771 RepID=A0A197JLX3_9FUNG|nr:hypothetical protein K457DRAFT_157874 [Linnemannia elongata AG-77]
MNPTSSSAFGSAFGGQGMAFGGGNSGNPSNTNPSGSAFANTGPGGGGGGSAFSNAGSSSSAFGAFAGGNSGTSAYNSYNINTASASGAPGTAFNNGGGFNSYNQTASGQSQFGAADGHSDNSRGRGRGRGGNNSYRGGRGGSNRGSANMTYVAPGLSTNQGQQQQQQHQPQTRSHLSSVFTAGSPGGESDSAFSAAGSNRGGGRGGYSGSPRGRGRGGAAVGGVPGQFRSIQWRPADGAQSGSANQGSDSAMAMDSTSEISNSASPSPAINTSSSGNPGSLQQHAAFSAFGVAGHNSAGYGDANSSTAFSANNPNAGFVSSNQNGGFAQQTGGGAGFMSSSFNKQWTPAASSATPTSAFQGSSSAGAFGIHTSTPAAGSSTTSSAFPSSVNAASTPAFQGNSSGSAFGIHTSAPESGNSTTSTFSSAVTAPQGLTTSAFRKGGFASSSPSTQGDSVFATPTSRPVSSPSASRPNQSVFTPPAKSSPFMDNSASRQISGGTTDSDSRLSRFSTNTIDAQEFEKVRSHCLKDVLLL